MRLNPPAALRIIGLVVIAPLVPVSFGAGNEPALYQSHCARCHGEDRLGGAGPALLPENLGRTSPAQAATAIRDGLPATQMPGFGGTLDEQQIASLVKLILTPLPEIPRWGLQDMADSHLQHADPATLPNKLRFQADPLNLFLVVETGDHHATVLDGERFEPIARFATRRALHGGPKYSPDGRFVYLASRDGWVSKYDLYNLTLVSELRAGINTRNIAVSDNGRLVMVANYLPHNLVVLDADNLSPLALIPAEDSEGHSSRVSAVYTAPPRGSFIAALKDIPEVWEIPYRQATPENGGKFPVRRIVTEDYLDDFFFDPEYRHLIGASRGGGGQVIDLERGEVIARPALPGLPHLGSGVSWQWQDTRVLVTPNLETAELSVLDMSSWKVIKHIPTLGPGFFMRTHESSPYAWSDVFFGTNKDAVHIIDKARLEIVRTLRPAPGKTAAHVEFSRDGRFALLSIWEDDGAVIVYDARTLEEIKRLPMRKPSGKYNVWNKTRYESGTSH
jgi:hypothetical protein